MNGYIELSVDENSAGQRLDVWLHEQLPELSRSRIQALLKIGKITIAGMPCKAHRRVPAGGTVAVTIPPVQPVELPAQDIPLNVVHEDQDVIVLNKQAGLVVHPSAGHADGTLVNALLFHCNDLAGVGGELRPGIVHRLDKDTSGLMITVKNDAAMDGMARQFKQGEVHKEYLAVVFGIPTPGEGRIETLIGRDPNDRRRMSAKVKEGRLSVSHYHVEEAFEGFALVRLRIETGRTHQIRVHMVHIGTPVLGDRQYAPRRKHKVQGVAVQRQMLHACKLRFTHPVSGELLEFDAPPPLDMHETLALLRGKQ